MTYKAGEISRVNDLELPPWERGVRQSVNGDFGLMNKQVMRKNLLDFKTAMEVYKIPFVFIFGSALGLVRGGDLIDYDTDVDVACFNEFDRKDHQKMYKLKSYMVRLGFTVVDSNEAYLHNDFFIRNGEKIEIWWFDKIDDEWIFGNTVRYPKDFFDNPKTIKLYGEDYLIPNNPEKFLDLTYGKDWRTPNKKKQYLSQNPKDVEKRR